MQPHFSRTLWFLASLIACLFVIASPLVAQQAPILVTQPVDNSVRTVLPGNVHPLARAEFDRGEAPSDLPLQRMLLVLKRSDRQETALRRLIENQQYKKSASYHQWLTPDQFGAQFGLADSDLAAVTNWLTASGFEVAQVSRGRTVIEFSGTAGLVKQAFGTAIHEFVIKGEQHWANVSNPSIPTALTPVVAGVNSLHNFLKKAQNNYVGKYSEETKQVSPQPEFTFSSGGFIYYALVPYDFATIYDLLPLWNAPTPINGTGQTIAIVGRTDIDPTDATTFWTLFGLDGVHAPRPTLKITHNGPPPGINGDEPEADIDTQWSGAAAPGATINFVTSATTQTTDGVDLSALYIVDNNLAPVMSTSYGLCEIASSSVDAFYGNLWEQAAAQGISAMVSTGDNGSAGCDDPNTSIAAQFGLNVNGLASTPFNVAVGGTDFNEYNTWSTYWKASNDPVTHESAKGPIPETTWNDSCTNSLLQFIGGSTDAETNCNDPNFSGFLDIVGGSGGQSLAWVGFKPAWQAGNGVPNDNTRDLPDVSLFASDGFLGSFYVICEKDQTGGVCNLNNFLGFGGTSVASPAFAGIMALVNQKWGPQGNPNFVLYNLPAKQPNAFHDVPSGSTIAMPCYTGLPDSVQCVTNTQGDQFGVLSGWATTTAYDLATGLGSVDAANLVNNWNKVTFTPSATTLTLNSGNPVNVMIGTSVPVAIGVTPTSPTPTGDVALLVSPGTPGNPGITFFTLASGGFTGSTNLLPVGTYSVVAHYEGDTTYGGSYSTPTASVTVNPDFTLPVPLTDPPAANPGQTTSTTMLLSPVFISTFSSTVTYSCSGLPAGATCSFSPLSGQIGLGSSATTVTITVQTLGPFTGAASGPQRRLRGQKQRLWLPLSLPLASMVLVGLAGRSLPRRYKIVGLCLALALTGFLVACGGGGSAPPPPPAISVTVAPTPVNTLYPNLAGAPAQTVNLTATVNNSTNQNVTWAITANQTDDSVSSTGANTATYTAPSAVPPGAVTVTATAQADTTKKGNATVNIQTPTPAGTYPITVTVTEGTTVHTTTFNLTVN